MNILIQNVLFYFLKILNYLRYGAGHFVSKFGRIFSNPVYLQFKAGINNARLDLLALIFRPDSPLFSFRGVKSARFLERLFNSVHISAIEGGSYVT